MPSSQGSAAHRIRCSPSTKEEGKRWIVVGPGARRLLGSGRSSPDRSPGTLLTDFYAPIDRVALRQVHSLGDKQRLQCRLAPELPSVGRNTSAWMRSGRRLGDRAGRAAQKSDWGIIAYSQVATSALRNAGEAPKVLMQMPASSRSVRTILAADSLCPNVTDGGFNALTCGRTSRGMLANHCSRICVS